MSHENHSFITDGSVQTALPEYAFLPDAAPQLVYLDFDGAETSYHNEALDVSIDDITVSSSGFDTTAISFIVADLNTMFGDDIVFTAEMPVSATCCAYL